MDGCRGGGMVSILVDVWCRGRLMMKTLLVVTGTQAPKPTPSLCHDYEFFTSCFRLYFLFLPFFIVFSLSFF